VRSPDVPPPGRLDRVADRLGLPEDWRDRYRPRAPDGLQSRLLILTAVFTSWRVVMDNPGPLARWAALLMALTLLGMAAGLLGLIPIVPWLAHASWHAYRDLVNPVGLETRPWA
jgi:hypothetical protein